MSMQFKKQRNYRANFDAVVEPSTTKKTVQMFEKTREDLEKRRKQEDLRLNELKKCKRSDP